MIAVLCFCPVGRGYKDNVKVNLSEVNFEDVNWFQWHTLMVDIVVDFWAHKSRDCQDHLNNY